MRALVSEISGSESDQNNDLEAYNNEIIAEQGNKGVDFRLNLSYTFTDTLL